ncbi:hypothetical protein ABL78_3746 [Leptomonas seymouri]|uniref:Uncharacterized protein n=1 Tax=Leptomonas seymouri TaxID=5684 RepID=A0A0N1IL57_LEPSE|nr:hypothetical protein ABL78_3746 [Leptomonas seymouri]|eukprot:KPI87184.1 hypothetical protein ABL78_3746 [Leptomonas seymouri]
MNRIRSFFRASSGAHAGERTSAARENKARTSAEHIECRSRASPKPHRQRDECPAFSEGATRTEHRSNDSGSVVSSTAVDHLYENYCDNITASEQWSQSGTRRPCMVMREYSDGCFAPSRSKTAVFLPPEYHIIGADDNSEAGALDGQGCLSDALTRTQGGTLLLKDGSTIGSAADMTPTSTIAMLGVQESSSDVGNVCGVCFGSNVARPLLHSLTASEVFSLRSEEDAMDVLSGNGSSAKRILASLSGKLRRNKGVRCPRQVTPLGAREKVFEGPTPEQKTLAQRSTENVDGKGNALTVELQEPSPVRRYSVSSWSFEEEANIHGRVRRIVIPPSVAAAGGGDGDRVLNEAPTGLPEVEVVRLNEALFTSSELALWRRYKVARLDSFVETAANEVGTPSTPTHSHDAPSVNSASGPEFMPMLGTANLASDTSARGWIELEDDMVEGETENGAPILKRRLVRVCNTDGTDSGTLRRGPFAELLPPLPSSFPLVEAQPATVPTGLVGDTVADPSAVPQNKAGQRHFSDPQPKHSCDRIPSGSSSSAVDARGENVSSDTNRSTSRSPSVSNLDAYGMASQVASPSTVSEAVSLPDIFGKTRAPTGKLNTTRALANMRHERSNDSAFSPCTTRGNGASEGFTPLPPLTLPHGSPTFHRRAYL